METSRVLEVPLTREGTQRMDDRSAARADWFDAAVASRIDAGYRLATIILGDPSEAEDATHDAIVLSWRRLDDLKDRALFDRWFGRIVVNACRDRLRRRRRWWAALPSLVQLGVEDSIGRADDRDRIGRAFRTLSADDRTILALRHFADLPVSEIAGRMGLPIGTAKSRLHRATLALRSALADPDSER